MRTTNESETFKESDNGRTKRKYRRNKCHNGINKLSLLRCEMFLNKALEARLLTGFAKGNYGQGWRDGGFILKNTFVDKFSRLDDLKSEDKYDVASNREHWNK